MTPKFKIVLRCISACAAAMFFSSQAHAQTILTFDGLLDGETVDAFYAGGLGSLGSGPGPDARVTMPSATVRLDSDAGGTGDFGGEPSPSAALFIDGLTTINVLEGFQTGLSFFYANPMGTTEVRLFEGPDLSGRVLSIVYFSATPLEGEGDPTGLNSPFVPAGMAFLGTARSIGIASRGAGGLYLDDLTLGSTSAIVIPERRYTLIDLGPVTDAFRRGSGPRANKTGQLFLQTRTDEDANGVMFWDPTLETPRQLGTFGGRDTIATGINAAGTVVGWSSLPDMTSHAFIWHIRDDGLRDLGTLGGPYSMAYGVNDAGHVVGSSSPADGSPVLHAFVWRNGVMTDLNDLTICNRENWQLLERAHSVSDNGVIVGSGIVSGEEQTEGVRHYFALVPLPN